MAGVLGCTTQAPAAPLWSAVMGRQLGGRGQQRLVMACNRARNRGIAGLDILHRISVRIIAAAPASSIKIRPDGILTFRFMRMFEWTAGPIMLPIGHAAFGWTAWLDNGKRPAIASSGSPSAEKPDSRYDVRPSGGGPDPPRSSLGRGQSISRAPCKTQRTRNSPQDAFIGRHVTVGLPRSDCGPSPGLMLARLAACGDLTYAWGP
jgi:hypothetical protein